MFKFENVLEIGQRVFTQWEGMICCDHCNVDRQAIVILPVAAERTLTLFEAACATYAVTHLDSGMSTHQNDPRNTSVSLQGRRLGLEDSPKHVVCLKSKMTFGTMEIDGTNAKLLARVLLSRSLLKLCSLLSDLKGTIGKLWDQEWAQQTDILKACETSIAGITDKLIILIGEIR